MKTYSLTVAGVQRELPIIKVAKGLSIASFVILGDTELICASAPKLVEKLPPCDLIVTAEAKGIALVFEMSRIMGMKRFMVARKSVKAYMDDPLVDQVNSITTAGSQLICFDRVDARAVAGKRVALVDDVISTGESLNALDRLVESAGGKVVARAAILAEGEAANRKDILFLETLPLFPDTDESKPV